MRAFIVASVVLSSVAASGQDTPLYPERGLAQFVVETLDVTSFPSSIGPRRTSGKTTFRDYNFLATKVDENRAVLEEPDGGWRFTLTILGQGKSGILICIEDQALNGGTYDTQSALSVARADARGLLKASMEKPQSKGCPEFAK